jgi:hypothetical protein
MKRIFAILILTLIIVSGLSLHAFGQTKTKKTVKKPTVKKVSAVVKPFENPAIKVLVKKNERPEMTTTNEANPDSADEPQKKNQPAKNPPRSTAEAEQSKNVYTYEFTQPNFLVSHIFIEYDETGKGKITFEKKDFGEPVGDPIQLSALSLEKINNLFQTLNFIESVEDYQSPIRQYAHLGTMKIGRKKDGRARLAEFNWTENKDARALADEYRRISTQFLWVFDISVSRENQPLEAPGLMDTLESLLKRGEISDPSQMIPLLKKLSDDERIPLMARNHAGRIIKQIEKISSGGK